jgi:hypothetical protein
VFVTWTSPGYRRSTRSSSAYRHRPPGPLEPFLLGPGDVLGAKALVETATALLSGSYCGGRSRHRLA